jgi:hypothetical protein
MKSPISGIPSMDSVRQFVGNKVVRQRGGIDRTTSQPRVCRHRESGSNQGHDPLGLSV